MVLSQTLSSQGKREDNQGGDGGGSADLKSEVRDKPFLIQFGHILAIYRTGEVRLSRRERPRIGPCQIGEIFLDAYEKSALSMEASRIPCFGPLLHGVSTICCFIWRKAPLLPL